MQSRIRQFLLNAHLYIAIFAAIVTTNVHAETMPPVPANYNKPGGDSFLISAFLDAADNSHYVMIDGGRRQGIVEGSVFRAFRRATTNQLKVYDFTWAETGRLKAVKVDEDLTYAQILSEEGPFTKSLFPKYPKLMAGDWATLERVSITRHKQITPTKNVAYRNLFEDPNAYPNTFELSEKGKALLTDLATRYASLRLSILLIQGYTDDKLPSDEAQVESYQRALTVRQFLIRELDFDPDRVVAMGLGETEPKDDSHIPGSADENRRVVFKAKALSDD